MKLFNNKITDEQILIFYSMDNEYVDFLRFPTRAWWHFVVGGPRSSAHFRVFFLSREKATIELLTVSHMDRTETAISPLSHVNEKRGDDLSILALKKNLDETMNTSLHAKPSVTKTKDALLPRFSFVSRTRRRHCKFFI